MQDLNDKVTGSALTPAEWNEVPSELQNIIEDTGQTLSSGDLDQVGKGICEYAGAGQYYTDGGAADAYVLTETGTRQAPPRYTDGLHVRFIAANTNTGASTINVSALGVKDLATSTGQPLDAGVISDSEVNVAYYNVGADEFRLMPTLNEALRVDLKSGRKNFLINGGFDIWQRGVSQTSFGYGSDDRWANENIGSTKTSTREVHPLGQTDVPGNPKYFSRTVAASIAGAANYVAKIQRIKGVDRISGSTVTVSFSAKADSSKDIATEIIQSFGTGGSPSSPVTGIGVTTHSLTSSWQRFTVTASIPDISGETLGTDGNDFLALYFWFDAGSNFDARTNSLGQQSGTFDISNVQVEVGSFATNFESVSAEETLKMCEPYCEKSYDLDVYPSTVTATGCIREAETRNNGLIVDEGVYYRAQKVVNPTITIYSTTSGTAGQVENAGDKAVSGLNNSGKSGFSGVTIAGGTSASPAEYQYISEAEI